MVKKTVNILQQWSIPLIAGVFVALLVANAAPQVYEAMVYDPFFAWPGAFETGGRSVETDTPRSAAAEEDPVSTPGRSSRSGEGLSEKVSDAGIGHYLALHFIINDIFMVFFFGVAAKEIVESCLPGGALNPPSKAVNPLLGTIGGVIGPISAYLLLNWMIGEPGWAKGWGIPTATDIALAWLVARIVFGAGHPAVSFLLLLAVADDAIGLAIIAFGYPDPLHPTIWGNTWWILPGMVVAFVCRFLKVQAWWPYILVGGAFAWWGLYSAGLHPALALVPIVPFLPHGPRDIGLFEEERDYASEESHGRHHSPLENFEHQLKLPVDFGLFFFAFANAGVSFVEINKLTWIVLLALLVGKVIGITSMSWTGSKIGFPLPHGMRLKHLFVASIVASIGLTVALFVAGQAFKVDMGNQSAAKMGALFSGAISIVAIIIGRMLGVGQRAEVG